MQSKEWFQEQLQFAQDARNKLQQDLANAQAQVKTQSKAVENLKAENAQVRKHAFFLGGGSGGRGEEGVKRSFSLSKIILTFGYYSRAFGNVQLQVKTQKSCLESE